MSDIKNAFNIGCTINSEEYQTNPVRKVMHNSTTRFAINWLFPSILISMVMVNQPFVSAIIIGQIFGWISYLAASIIALNAFQQKRWVVIIIILIIITKVLRIVTGSDFSEIAYISFLNTLMCIAGSVVIFQHPNLIYRQVMVFLLLNFIVMIFQVTGIGGEYSQLLTTHGEGNLTKPVNTIFVEQDRMKYLLVQGRPAGISYSNVILSLIILFGIVLHFSRNKDTYKWGTPLLCGIIVLSMAKMAFLGFIFAIFLTFLFGAHLHKIRILKATVLIIIFIALYSVIFPGLMSVNLAKETIDASFFLRANEIMLALNPDIFSGEKKAFFEGTRFFSTGEEGEFVSGYGLIISKIYNHLILIIIFAILLILTYLVGLLKQKKKFPELTLKMIMTISIIGIFPATHPIWTSQIYWFMLGFGFLPLYYFRKPRFLYQI